MTSLMELRIVRLYKENVLAEQQDRVLDDAWRHQKCGKTLEHFHDTLTYIYNKELDNSLAHWAAMSNLLDEHWISEHQQQQSGRLAEVKKRIIQLGCLVTEHGKARNFWKAFSERPDCTHWPSLTEIDAAYTMSFPD